MEKSTIAKQVNKPTFKEIKIGVKLNSKEFKDQIEKFSNENQVSKKQARKKIFWQTIKSRKPSIICQNS